MVTLGPLPRSQFIDANGQPLVGGLIYTYEAGTTTPLATYMDSTGVSANPNPIVLDARGEANIWFLPQLYKIVLKSSTGDTIYTVDNVSGFLNAGYPVITNGTIDGVVIGGTTPAEGSFTNLTATIYIGQWSSIPAGTSMLFVQSAAPVGWTKSITHNNKALRVVSGTAGSGGSVGFTSAFSAQSITGTVNNHILTIDQIPYVTGAGALFGTSLTTGATVNSGSHSHTFTGTAINLAVQYVDVIIATKA